jgi:uncharacterized heparinase superfamily protein
MTAEAADLIAGAADRRTQRNPRPLSLGARVREAIYRSRPYRAWLTRSPLPTVRRPPTEPWIGRLSTANALFQGRYDLAGFVVQVPNRSPWDLPPPHETWAAALHGFSWLRHFRAASGTTSRQHARELVRGWMQRHGTFDSAAWQPQVLAARVLAWKVAHQFLLFEADDPFRRHFSESLALQVRHLVRTLGREPPGATLDVAVAVAVVGGAMDMPRWLRRGMAAALAAIARDVLTDGGHASRNPLRVHATLRTLVTLRDGLASLGLAVPAPVGERIEAMAGLLRMLRHDDGGLAVFHGGAEGDPALLDETLRAAEAKGKALASAPTSGFERLTCGRMVVLYDTLAAGPHRSPLAIEVAIGRDRLIVNCGGQADAGGAWAEAASATAAHSTLVIDDRNARMPAAADPASAQTLRGEAGTSVWLEASHAGYAARFGLRHRRRLHAAKDGYELVCEDGLTPMPGEATDRAATAAIRLHLHPSVSASLVRSGREILMRLPSGAGWMFEATAGAVALEESIYCGQPREPRRTQQIVLTLPIGDAGLDVTWRLARVED